MANIQINYFNGTSYETLYPYAYYADSSGNATQLANSRTIRTNLASTSTASFNGTSNITPGVTGTLSVSNGGTGVTSLSSLASNLSSYLNGAKAQELAWTGNGNTYVKLTTNFWPSFFFGYQTNYAYCVLWCYSASYSAHMFTNTNELVAGNSNTTTINVIAGASVDVTSSSITLTGRIMPNSLNITTNQAGAALNRNYGVYKGIVIGT